MRKIVTEKYAQITGKNLRPMSVTMETFSDGAYNVSIGLDSYYPDLVRIIKSAPTRHFQDGTNIWLIGSPHLSLLQDLLVSAEGKGIIDTRQLKSVIRDISNSPDLISDRTPIRPKGYDE